MFWVARSIRRTYPLENFTSLRHVRLSCPVNNHLSRLGEPKVFFSCWRQRFACFSQTLFKNSGFVEQPSNQKREDALEVSCAEKNCSSDSTAALTAQWKWVTRGKYKVAAFTANVPAIALDSDSGSLHRHKCMNCLTDYDHSHSYGSLYHPQHIKDCPKCKALAPDDVKIT